MASAVRHLTRQSVSEAKVLHISFISSRIQEHGKEQGGRAWLPLHVTPLKHDVTLVSHLYAFLPT